MARQLILEVPLLVEVAGWQLQPFLFVPGFDFHEYFFIVTLIVQEIGS